MSEMEAVVGFVFFVIPLFIMFWLQLKTWKTGYQCGTCYCIRPWKQERYCANCGDIRPKMTKVIFQWTFRGRITKPLPEDIKTDSEESWL